MYVVINKRTRRSTPQGHSTFQPKNICPRSYLQGIRPDHRLPSLLYNSTHHYLLLDSIVATTVPASTPLNIPSNTLIAERKRQELLSPSSTTIFVEGSTLRVALKRRESEYFGWNDVNQPTPKRERRRPLLPGW